VYTGTGAVWENPTRGIPVFNPKQESLDHDSDNDGEHGEDEVEWTGIGNLDDERE
jgi:hypothetical protein